MIIKVALLVGVVGFAVVLFRGPGGARQRAIKRLIAIALALLAVLAILEPQTVTWIANKVGVGRGSDLVLYVLVVAFLWVMVGTSRRLAELERRNIDIARRMAVHDALCHQSTMKCASHSLQRKANATLDSREAGGAAGQLQ